MKENTKREEVFVKLVVMILNKVDVLEDLLLEFANRQIKGATILSSTGMAHTLYNSSYDQEASFFLGSIRSLLNPEREESKTILLVLKEEQVSSAVEALDQVTGGLNKPDTGIVFTLPVDYIKGIEI
jgi:hypothetical protein